MSFAWKDFLHIAEYLLAEQPGEYKKAAYRTIVSRAYYAAYHCTRCYAQTSLNYIPSKTSQHESLRSFLNAKGKVKLFRQLDKLFKWRIQCDYDETVAELSENMAVSAINITKNLFSLLN